MTSQTEMHAEELQSNLKCHLRVDPHTITRHTKNLKSQNKFTISVKILKILCKEKGAEWGT